MEYFNKMPIDDYRWNETDFKRKWKNWCLNKNLCFSTTKKQFKTLKKGELKELV